MTYHLKTFDLICLLQQTLWISLSGSWEQVENRHRTQVTDHGIKLITFSIVIFTENKHVNLQTLELDSAMLTVQHYIYRDLHYFIARFSLVSFYPHFSVWVWHLIKKYFIIYFQYLVII